MSANYQAQLVEIADARRAVERTTEAIAERQQQAEQMASADRQFYQASAVARQLAEIAELEDRQRVAELRIKALERQLPSEQTRATARAEAEALADAALEAAAGAGPAWDSFLAALAAAEIAATAFATAKAEADVKAHQARTVERAVRPERCGGPAARRAGADRRQNRAPSDDPADTIRGQRRDRCCRARRAGRRASADGRGISGPPFCAPGQRVDSSSWPAGCAPAPDS